MIVVAYVKALDRKIPTTLCSLCTATVHRIYAVDAEDRT